MLIVASFILNIIFFVFPYLFSQKFTLWRSNQEQQFPLWDANSLENFRNLTKNYLSSCNSLDINFLWSSSAESLTLFYVYLTYASWFYPNVMYKKYLSWTNFLAHVFCFFFLAKFFLEEAEKVLSFHFPFSFLLSFFFLNISWYVEPLLIAAIYPKSWKLTSRRNGPSCPSLWCGLGVPFDERAGDNQYHSRGRTATDPCNSTTEERQREPFSCKWACLATSTRLIPYNSPHARGVAT